MHTTEQSSTRQELMTTAAVIDPAERRRRLWKVYALLLNLTEQQEAASPDKPSDQAQPMD
jgi:hypothetical protein